MPDLTLRGGVGARIDTEIEIKRSRFLCRLVRVESEAEARAVVDAARREEWNARHHCSAFVIGAASAPDQLRRSNDDGEPSGTAGRPMLEAISGRDFIDSVAVVSRYFGGVLLGAGGLVRAYSDSVLATIDEAHARGDVVARERRALYTLALPHADAGRIEADLRHRGVNILGTAYGSRAVITLSGPGRSELHELVAAVTAGGGVLEAAGHELIDVEP